MVNGLRIRSRRSFLCKLKSSFHSRDWKRKWKKRFTTSTHGNYQPEGKLFWKKLEVESRNILLFIKWLCSSSRPSSPEAKGNESRIMSVNFWTDSNFSLETRCEVKTSAFDLLRVTTMIASLSTRSYICLRLNFDDIKRIQETTYKANSSSRWSQLFVWALEVKFSDRRW